MHRNFNLNLEASEVKRREQSMTNGPRYKTSMHKNYTQYNFSPEQQRSPYSKLDIPVKNNKTLNKLNS